MAPARNWVLFLGALVLFQCISNASGQSGNRWIWCVESDETRWACDTMTGYLSNLDPAHIHSCVIGPGDDGCMEAIQNGTATFGLFDGGEILEAQEEHNLTVVRTESAPGTTGLYNRYYGVGVVKKGKCPKDLNDLKGKKSCHTGYGRTSGWVLPMTYLLDQGVMDLVIGEPSNDVASVKAFFSASCAAHNDEDKICSACKETVNCDEEDPYYDYEGAFRGLVEDACDIAFTKNDIPTSYAMNGANEQPDWTGLQEVSEYQIICPMQEYMGEFCTDVTNYEECNFGTGPSHSIMVAENFRNVTAFNNLMDDANNDPNFKDLFFTGKNGKGLIFSADTTTTVAYNDTIPTLLGTLYNTTLTLESYNDQTSPPPSAAATTRINTMAGVIALFVAAILSL